MAYTLADYARLADNDLKRGVIDIFRRESFAMDVLSWDDSDTLSIQAIRTKDLPSVGFRRINESFSASKGTVEPIQERVFDMGAYVDVDKLLVKAKSIVDQRALQTDMFTTALAYNFNDYFINGQPTVDEDGFTGLWYRIKNYVTAQVIAAGGLDVSPDGATLSADFQILLDHIQGLIHLLDGHKADALFMNSTMYLRLMSCLRQLGMYATTKDTYNRTIVTYGEGGPKIYDLGVKADQSTKIITDTEHNTTGALTGGGSTSIYAVKTGEKYLMGFQLYGIDVNDVGMLESGIAYRTVIDWPVGLYHVNPRAFARLHGIIAA